MYWPNPLYAGIESVISFLLAHTRTQTHSPEWFNEGPQDRLGQEEL